ncbi:hypothetical protein ACT4S5_11845 [Kocuria oceani]|uniref:hypothetical protein n=1 Tax=Kocuria oceani TaxID=988827 RepID=UPI0040362CC8
MTVITRTARTAATPVREDVLRSLSARGIGVSSADVLSEGREWSVVVSGRPADLTETEVRIAVWNTVLNHTAVHGLPEPVDGVRIRLDG